ncbi:MAG TPA: helix-turn-helix transcriptional regulator [Longimicrobium sp.]|jgi:transcriptional regulator with XRE-family HTH domain|nr:helix-turn-helix transcriptional regulator [Longimicrobium sp.]
MTMDSQKKARLEAAGFRFATVSEWLGLTQAESHHIEIALALRFLLRDLRKRARLTQAQAARKLKTSQSRFSKMENGAPSVSLDLMITSALGLGATFREIGEAIASWPGEPGVEDDAGAAGAGRTRTPPSAEPQGKSAAPAARPVRRTRSAKAA